MADFLCDIEAITAELKAKSTLNPDFLNELQKFLICAEFRQEFIARGGIAVLFRLVAELRYATYYCSFVISA